MRISDWSSDVCSSDLLGAQEPAARQADGGDRAAARDPAACRRHGGLARRGPGPEQPRSARCMTVTAIMPERLMNLVAPLAHKATDKHEADTAGYRRAWTGAAATVNGSRLRPRGGTGAIRSRTRP